MVPTLFVIARLTAVALLLWAVGKHSHNYYVFLRWFVFFIAAWGAFRACQPSDREWVFILMHVALAILFNPFLPFTFQKSTWTIFNIIAALVVLISIAVLEPEPLERFMGIKIRNAVHAVFTGTVGIGIILLGVLLIHTAMDRLLDRWSLWRHAQQTKAEITQVAHTLEFVESESERRAGYRHSYEVDYIFQVSEQRYSGKASLSDNPLPEEIEEEQVITPASRTYIDIEYQSSNPHNNHTVAESNLLRDVFPSLLLLAIGLWPTVAGVNFLKTQFSNNES